MLGGSLVSLVYTSGYTTILDTGLPLHLSSGTGTYVKPFERIGEGQTFTELKSGAEKPGPLAHLAEFLPWVCLRCQS